MAYLTPSLVVTILCLRLEVIDYDVWERVDLALITFSREVLVLFIYNRFILKCGEKVDSAGGILGLSSDD